MVDRFVNENEVRDNEEEFGSVVETPQSLLAFSGQNYAGVYKQNGLVTIHFANAHTFTSVEDLQNRFSKVSGSVTKTKGGEVFVIVPERSFDKQFLPSSP